MALFNISPSEAVLIGCCMGEYLEARQDNEYANVLHFFWKWLSPVVPNFETSTTTAIRQDELPLDLEWTEFGGDRSLAIDARDPRIYYERTATETTRTQWDRPQSSLLDLLGDLVDQFVSKSNRDELRFPTNAGRTVALLHREQVASLGRRVDELEADSFEFAEYLHNFKVSIESGFVTPESPDNVEAVIAAVKRLMSENATEEYYLVGQLFGKTSATIERWERSLYHDPFGVYCSFPPAEYRNKERLWSLREDRVLTDDYHSNVRELLGAGLVRGCAHAAAILAAEASRSVVSLNWDPEYRNGPTLMDGLVAMLCPAEARKAVWFALGFLLGTLRDVDDAARERDRRSLAPRPYLLSSRASPEQIAGLIRMVEQTFGDIGDKNLQPEYVVNCLANAIEGLAKKLWPKEFDHGSRKGELRNVLQAHFATGSEAERRFARLRADAVRRVSKTGFSRPLQLQMHLGRGSVLPCGDTHPAQTDGENRAVEV